MSNDFSTSPSEPEWAALAAIDWADQKHFWRLLPAGSRQSEAGALDNWKCGRPTSSSVLEVGPSP
jgi:hypothetical protein